MKMNDFIVIFCFSGCPKMACHDQDNLRCMIDTCFSDKLFSRSLKDSTFSGFSRGVENSKKKKFKLLSLPRYHGCVNFSGPSKIEDGHKIFTPNFSAHEYIMKNPN